MAHTSVADHRPPRPRAALLSLLIAAGSCSSAGRPENPFESGTGGGGSQGPGGPGTGGPGTSGGGDAGESGGSGGTNGAGASSGATTTGPLFDVGGGQATAGCTDPDGMCGEGCTAVDLLFVIDNSISMKPHQEALAAAFPGFVDAMWNELPPGTSLHVGVTTTSIQPACCGEATNNCVSEYSEDWIRTNCYENSTPDVMDTGENGGQGRLYVYQGKSYFEAVVGMDDPAPLKTWFTEVADQTGEVGSCVEMPAAGAGLVTHPANAGTNDGFIRDAGAALILFVLTDEPDKSPEPVQMFADMLIGAKAACGGADCIRAAGFVPNGCYESPNDTTLYDFMNAFGEPPLVDFITKGFNQQPPDYTGLVGQALAEVVAQQCQEIPPQG